MNTTITSEGEKLSRCSCHVGHSICDCGKNPNVRHCCCVSLLASCIVEDLDERVASRSAQVSIQIAQSIAKCDQHHEAQSAVDNDC